MSGHNFCVLLTIVLLGHALGLELNKQRYTQNTDFLSHEAGLNLNDPSKDKVASLPNIGTNFGKRDYVAANFPPLQPPPNSHSIHLNSPLIPQSGPLPSSTQSSSKRDFLSPNNGNPQPPNSGKTNPVTQPSQSTQHPNGKRDYVNPNFPPLRPPSGFQSTSQSTPKVPQSSPQPSITQPSGKRDYVNPNLQMSTQQGKVKDLVNFYDSKSKSTPMPPKGSYSSILQGPEINNQGSVSKPSTTSHSPNSPTPKPLSWSSIVTGSKNQGVTTNRPSTASTHKSTASTPSRPSSVLPSSILQNTNNQGSNGNSNSVSDAELQILSEELLRKDSNNAAKYVTINYQGKTTSQSLDDKAPLPLLTVSSEAWNIPTIQKFVPLLDNYDRDTQVNEYVTPQERNEENAFMDAIMSTAVIRHLMSFMKEKGFVTPDPKQQRDFLKQLWFSLYSRGKGKLSSSGFEHSFVSEVNKGNLLGLHNWIYFTKEEQANRLNYLGYLKYTDFNGKGAVIKTHFNHQGTDKPVDSLFIGTSPELEIALYTLCFVTRVDSECNIKLAGKDIRIMTHKFRYRSKNYVGSAYPQI